MNNNIDDQSNNNNIVDSKSFFSDMPMVNNINVNSNINSDTPIVNNNINSDTYSNNGLNGSNDNINNNVTNVAPKKKRRIKSGVLFWGFFLLFFIIFYLSLNFYFNNPKYVFKRYLSIINNYTNSLLAKNSNSTKLEYNFKFDTNVDFLSSFNNYSYTISSGIDKSNGNFEGKIGIKDKENDTFIQLFRKDKKYYTLLSNYENVIKLEDNFITSIANEVIDEYVTDSIKDEDLKYFNSFIFNFLKDNLSNKKFYRETTNIKIGDSNYKVKKNYIKLNKKDISSIIDTFYKKAKNDKKVAKIIDLNDYDKDLINSYSDDYSIEFSLYTGGFTNRFNGFEIKTSDGLNIYLYCKSDNINSEITVNNKSLFKINTESNHGVSNGELYFNNNKIASLKINSFNSKKIEFTFNILIDNIESPYNGNIKLDFKNSNFLLKFCYEKEFVEIKGNYIFTYDSKISDIDIDNSVSLNSVEMNKVISDFMKNLKDTPIGKIFTTISGDLLSDYAIF